MSDIPTSMTEPSELYREARTVFWGKRDKKRWDIICPIICISSSSFFPLSPSLTLSLSLSPFPYRGLLEGIIGPTVVNVMTHAWNKQGQDLKIGQHLLQLWAILEKSVAEMSHGEGVHPVMVGRVPVAFLNHHHKPREIKNHARRHVTCHVTYLAKLLRGILHLESSFMSSIMLMMHWEEEKINTILNTTT